MARAAVGLGGNLGDRRALLARAIDWLQDHPRITHLQVSRWCQTNPVGGTPGQPDFWNGASTFDTDLNPIDLLDLLAEIERRSGRERRERWSERTIDLDLLLVDGQEMDTPRLRLPHPRLACRRFVLGPLASIAPQWVDPLSNRSVVGLLERLDRRPAWILAEGCPTPAVERADERLKPMGWALVRGGLDSVDDAMFVVTPLQRWRELAGELRVRAANGPITPIIALEGSEAQTLADEIVAVAEAASCRLDWVEES